MELDLQQYLEQFRQLRQQYLGPVVKPLVEWGIHPDYITFTSLFFGLIAVWLFDNPLWFFVFAFFHLFFDAFDGVVARLEHTESLAGKFFDDYTDNLLAILLILRFAWGEGSTIAGLIAVLYLTHMAWFWWNDMEGPVLYARSLLFVLFILAGLYAPFAVWAVYLTGILALAGLGWQAYALTQ